MTRGEKGLKNPEATQRRARSMEESHLHKACHLKLVRNPKLTHLLTWLRAQVPPAVAPNVFSRHFLLVSALCPTAYEAFNLQYFED